MDCFQTLESPFEFRSKLVVHLLGVSEHSVSSADGQVQNSQKGGSGRLLLSRSQSLLVLFVNVHQRRFREVFGRPRNRVDMVPAKIRYNFQSLLNGQFLQVLVSKYYDAPLSNKSGQVVLALVRELRQLNTSTSNPNLGEMSLTE